MEHLGLWLTPTERRGASLTAEDYSKPYRPPGAADYRLIDHPAGIIDANAHAGGQRLLVELQEPLRGPDLLGSH